MRLTRIHFRKSALIAAIGIAGLSAAAAFAGQGAAPALYTVPRNPFIQKPFGETVVTINDASGSIATLQTSINSARNANPASIIVIRLLTNATYSVSSAGLILGSRQCLVAGSAILQAADASVSVPLIQVTPGSTHVSVAGGTLDGNGAKINGILAPAAARVNVDRVLVRNCGLDGILLKGRGNGTFDNEMTVTRCDVSGSSLHAGISIQNATQCVLVDNDSHNNQVGIHLSCVWGNAVNNVCRNNTTGIDIAGGSDNVVANNTCTHNGTGIRAAGSKNMIVSNSTGGNSTAGIASTGRGNNFIDNLFTAGNGTNFISGGSDNNVVAYKAPLRAPDQNYFYPPLMDDLHASRIVNDMGRTDLVIGSTTIDSVQSQYNAARRANPDNVVVLHLTGDYTVGATALTLSENTCVLLNGTIQINSATTANAAIRTETTGSQGRICISGGIIDGGKRIRNNAIQISRASMVQMDAMTLRNFGAANRRMRGSDTIHFDHGLTPYIVTRCTIDGSSSRGIWLQLSGVKSVISDNDIANCNQDAVDCDSSTSGSVVKFNNCHDLVRYGVFFEQSASNNLAIGNLCARTGRGINMYNNNHAPAIHFNTAACNRLDANNNGLRNGSISTNIVTLTSHNFFFNNAVQNSTDIGIQGDASGTENYYSQNDLAGNKTPLVTSGSETFFNPPPAADAGSAGNTTLEGH